MGGYPLKNWQSNLNASFFYPDRHDYPYNPSRAGVIFLIRMSFPPLRCFLSELPNRVHGKLTISIYAYLFLSHLTLNNPYVPQ